ncbi:hypothetical protein MD484_g4393, partial [Candolleomyces efflorescens]
MAQALMNSAREELTEALSLTQDAVLSGAWAYPVLGIAYLASHASLYKAVGPVVIKALLASAGITIGMFVFTYLPQVALCAIVTGPLAFIPAAIMVLAESYVIASVVSRTFFLSEAQDKIFDAVLLQQGNAQLVEGGRETQSSSSGVKKLGKSLYKPLNRFSPASILRYVASLPLNSIPVVGTALFLLYNGRKLGPTFHGRYFQLKGFNSSQSQEYVGKRKAAYTAFGSIALVLSLIPIAGFAFSLTSTIGAALWASKLEKAGSGGDSRPTEVEWELQEDRDQLWGVMAPEQSQKQELEAFINFFKTFQLSRPLTTASDLNDGAIFFDILSLVDDVYFRQQRPSAQPSENWVLRFSALKRLYRLMTQYFADILQKQTTSLEVPDLQAIAKDSDIPGVLTLCRLTVVIGVQCESNKDFIDKIQGLNEADQHVLMKAIEQVMGKIGEAGTSEPGEAHSMTEDDHYYRVQSERSQIFNEKETLEKVYRTLLEEHRQLQSNLDDVVQEKDEALSQLRTIHREVEGSRRSDKSDTMLRAELDRVRGELQKSEDNLAIAESELDKNTNVVAELTRKIDELQEVADEAAKLKDQLDEYRHAADKLHKTENVMQKYKKKLQESADLRHQLKAIEQQNSDLVNKNAALEEEYRKVAAFKPLMESYKNQIADLEAKNSSRNQDIESLKFELDQTRTKLKISQEERAKDAESLELYQERVKELELTSSHRSSSQGNSRSTGLSRLNSSASEDFPAVTPTSPNMETDDEVHGLGEELDDAIAGRTTTDLKLQIKKLQRELEAHKKNEADTSRLLVLENLLEDANRMKARYESDYLAAHREKLMLQRDLDEIRSGKSLGDGPEAAIALRQRLNETVEQLEELRKAHAELEVKYDTMNRELTIAKSDLTLVNKDQLDILASLRESVNEDKAELEADVDKLKKQNKDLNEKSRMQLEQINGLLMEKMNLQTEGIGHREKLLLQRDLNNELNSVLPGNVPEEFRQRWLSIHEDNIAQKETIKGLNEKLVKARQVLKLQDKLIKDGNAANVSIASQGALEESETGLRSQVKLLEEEVAREKKKLVECQARYSREHELMLSCIHNLGMRSIRNQLVAPPRVEKTSFLGTHRTGNTHVLRRS